MQITAITAKTQLANLLGLPLVYISDQNPERRLAILKQLYAAKEAEWAKRATDFEAYNFDRHMDLAGTLGDELDALCFRKREFSAEQWAEVMKYMPKIAA